MRSLSTGVLDIRGLPPRAALPTTRGGPRTHAGSLPRVLLRRLHPTAGEVAARELAAELDLAALAPAERPYLVLNMVSSVDGKATYAGKTRGLSSELDRTLFHELRTRADAVMVGAGTARVERYGRLIKREDLRERRREVGLEPDPPAVIVSARLDLPTELPLLQDEGSRVLVATASTEQLDGVRADVEYLRTGDDLPLLMTRLRQEQGIRSILCEGGPTLNSYLLAAELVDELFLSLSPRLLGGADAVTIVAGRPLLEPVDLELVWLAEGGGELYGRWRVRRGFGRG
jgi:riboflavin-specific deaminase-like protein